MADPRVRAAQARLGTAHRRLDRDPAEIAAARTALNEAKIRAWVEKTLAEAPPHLSPETTARLARLLAPSGGEQS